jgi:hypothetical protein
MRIKNWPVVIKFEPLKFSSGRPYLSVQLTNYKCSCTAAYAVDPEGVSRCKAYKYKDYVDCLLVTDRTTLGCKECCIKAAETAYNAYQKCSTAFVIG